MEVIGVFIRLFFFFSFRFKFILDLVSLVCFEFINNNKMNVYRLKVF